MDLMLLNRVRSVKGRIFSFSQSARNPSDSLESIGVSEIGRTPLKLSFLSSFFKRL